MQSTQHKRDGHFMRLAFNRAAHGSSATPNPRVGALVVAGESVVGSACHAGAGSPHAEVLAIKAAGNAIRGATLYCTLEPCHRQDDAKRTPPCVPQIITAHPARVVVGATDPHPAERGRSLSILKAKGIAVTHLQMDNIFAAQNEGYLCRVRNKRLLIHLKWAQTLDGYSSDHRRRSQWITDSPARAAARQLRAQCGAVLIGRETTKRDNPHLTVRTTSTENPAPLPPRGGITRLVLDSQLRLPPTLRLFRDQTANPTVVFHANDVTPQRQARYRRRGVKLIALPAERGRITNHLSLPALMDWANQQLSVNGILVEGGPTLCGSFLRQGIWDKLTLFIAPTFLGGGFSASAALGSLPISRHLQPQLPTWEPLAALHSTALQFRAYRNTNESFGIASQPYAVALAAIREMEQCNV